MMTSLAAPRRPLFFPSRLPRISPPLPPSFAPISLTKSPGLQFSVRSSQSGRRRHGRRGKRGGWKAKWEDDPSEPAAAIPPDLEAEIYEFMQQSANPNGFPTKQELLAAGRADLVEAIATLGGWLTFGWAPEDERRGSSDSVPSPAPNGDESLQEDSRVSEVDSARPADMMEPSSMASPSGRSMEMEGGQGLGIEGILSRLEKERSLSYASGLREKEVNDENDWEDTVLVACKRTAGDSERNNGTLSLDSKNLLDDFGANHSKDGTSAEVKTPDKWRTWSLQRTGLPESDFEAAEIIPNEGRKQLDRNFIPDSSTDDDKHKIANNVKEAGKEPNILSSDAKQSSQNHMHMRLQHLESELKSARNLLRTRNNRDTSHKGDESSLKELHKLSDALEFQETEILNARDKLRSTRAKLAVLEGKIAFDNIEAQKIMAERQKRLDAAQETLRHLRTTCIVWPNSASEVLLTGSFDGWFSQRRMERSSRGVFSLCLKLYPGRYEIKFIVDGVWKVDPLRPIVHNNGHENNLLIVT